MINETMNILQHISQELETLPDGWIIMTETSVEKSLPSMLILIKYLIQKKDSYGIVVSASRPYNNLVRLYREKSIDTDKIFFIDCISKSQGGKLEEASNVVYQNAVSDLTNISLSIKMAIDNISGKKFVFIDSITAMIIHNNPQIFTRFIHGIITKLRIMGVSGLLISLEEETDNHTRAQIAELCDKVIKI
jgi:hypothetical protein